VTASTATEELLDLLDWKRRIFALYAEVRAAASPMESWMRWQDVRDELFGSHPQSPVPRAQRESFSGLSYFPYDPELRVVGELVPLEQTAVGIGASNGAPIRFLRFAEARFELLGEMQVLDVYWLEAYGGGVFLPFGDATNGDQTYGAGRYLLDTVKGADLGSDGDGVVLDFNFAYNPSCAYDPSWPCPLAPPRNRLDIEIRGGESVRRT
jgi:uncharacterized protein (DUF1684 family)